MTDIGKLVWDKALVGLAETNVEGKFLRVNPYFCDLVEYSEAELLSRTWHSITHPDDVEDDQNMRRRLIAGEMESYRMFKRYITKSGKVLAIKLTITSVLDDDGNFKLFLSQSLPASFAKPNVDHKKMTLRDIDYKPIGEFLRMHGKWFIPTVLSVVGTLFVYFLNQHVAMIKVQDTLLQLLESIKTSTGK